MFLFTTQEQPSRSAPQLKRDVPTHVINSIENAAKKTGINFDYLARTAERESGFNPAARAKNSSASGLFQVIDQTWLALVKEEGPKYGLANEAASIAVKPDGSYFIQNQSQRKEILDLRFDPQIASVMTGALTQKNRDALASEIGREPKAGDLYAAHFLGASGAINLIVNAQRNPSSPAINSFPEAAAANRSIFYDKAGSPRSYGELYAVLAGNHGDSDIAGKSAGESLLSKNNPNFHGLFQTDVRQGALRQGAVSESIAKLWRGRGLGNESLAAEAQAYYPRSQSSSYVGATVSKPSSVSQPVMQQRSADASLFSSKTRSFASQESTRQALNLSAFMKVRATP
jgi:hypothetical protein